MQTERGQSSQREERLAEAVLSFERALDEGRSPDPAEWLARYPDLADELRSFFADQAAAARAAGPLRDLGRETPDPLRPEADTPTGDFTPPPGPDAEPPAGFDRLGDLVEVARGGMGVVYRGRDPDLGGDLAVKVLRQDHASRPEMVRRFLAEAKLTAGLQHPGIAPVHAVGRVPDGRPYFTMKLIRGRTLAELLRERPDPADELPRWLMAFEQVCQAVAYAHSEGILHRDLKPVNVMVGAFGEVQVMDWGLAKALPRNGIAAASDTAAGDDGSTPPDAGRLEVSQPGSVVGTFAYMPPEQANGQAVDERADVFGLGAILCEILTGLPPYVGLTAEAVRLQAMMGDLAGALGRLNHCGADPEQIALARSCLAREPEGRPRDGRAVAGAVAAYLAGMQ
jgi:serine/threonine-protein kinase